MTIEKVSQDDMLTQFRQRMEGLLEENQKLVASVRQNEQTILKLKGAIEALEYYVDPPAEEEVPAADTPPEE